jgi:uncharacterized protein
MKLDKSVQITLIIVLGIVFLGVIGFYTINSFNPTQSDTITVNGRAEFSAVPDLVTIYFNVKTTGDTSSEATQENSEIVTQAKSNLLALGIEQEKIITENFNVYPNYEWINNKRVEKGYIATHSLKIEISTSQTEMIGSVIDAGVNAGAGISYINFELSPEKQSDAKAEAIKLAAQDATIQAEALAEGLDKKVGKLVSVSLDNFGYYPWRVYSASNDVMEEDAVMAKEATTNIQPGEKDISASVRAVYKIK